MLCESSVGSSAPAALLHDQSVVLTVPASFDEGARALTLEAAKLAGLPDVQLLEEPKAAFPRLVAAAGRPAGWHNWPTAAWCWWWTWWRHHRPDADSRAGLARAGELPTLTRIAVGEHPDAGRRQHGPGAGPHQLQEPALRVKANACPRSAFRATGAALPHGKGSCWRPMHQSKSALPC